MSVAFVLSAGMIAVTGKFWPVLFEVGFPWRKMMRGSTLCLGQRRVASDIRKEALHVELEGHQRS